MRRRFLVGLLAAALALAAPLVVLGDVTVAPGGGTPGTSQNFQLVGHNDLFGRGMNAALAVFDHYVYVGNRTDGSLPCSQTGGVQPCHASANVHVHPGVLIVDVADPSNPAVVGELGPPNAALPGITTRELRVWPEKKFLMIMTFRCSSAIHDCPPGNDTTFPFDIKFFDLSDPCIRHSSRTTSRGRRPDRPSSRTRCTSGLTRRTETEPCSGSRRPRLR